MSKTLKKSDLIEMVMRGIRRNTVHFGTLEEDAKRIVDNYLNNEPTNAPWWEAEVISYMKAGRKLAGVKALKDATGLSLKDAKQSYEYYENWGEWNITEEGRFIL
jgi:hypothetical protein